MSYPYPERGERLIRKMAEQNIGVRELARRISDNHQGITVSPSTISGWRSGAEMKERQILAVCAELGISADELLNVRRCGDSEFWNTVSTMTDQQRRLLVEWVKSFTPN